LHKKDKPLLEMIKVFFGNVGFFTKHGENSVSYRVTSVKDLTTVIVPHFDKYPLITKKLVDYILFKQALEIIARKDHLTYSGLHRLVAIKASINLGLSKDLKNNFPPPEEERSDSYFKTYC
jgi:LAGLIDADG endonuclease